MKGVFKYPCKKCDFKGSQQVQLKFHIKSIHGGFKYPCDKCDYEATQVNFCNNI